MKTIYIVGCSAQKSDKKTQAIDLYKGDLFKKSVGYAIDQGAKKNEIFVLSALHGLLPANENVGPYDVTLNDMTAAELRSWAVAATAQLLKLLPHKVNICCLAGKKYALAVDAAAEILNVAVTKPLKSLGIGQQKAWLKNNTGVTANV